MGDELIRRIVQLGFHKRDFFRGENEWRAVTYQNQESGIGVKAEVDLDKLIDSVCVHPKAQTNFLEAVCAIMEKVAPGKSICRSEILMAPSGSLP
jgi:hypothetical protein